MNGKSYVSSKFIVTTKHCLFLSGAVPQDACTSEGLYPLLLLLMLINSSHLPKSKRPYFSGPLSFFFFFFDI